ncbi:MAG: hypothetical protein VKJ05_08495 [Synechococcaceae cyanobacterium]|nr:hypothetical protein [Synechococcaceae cyanobacterium]
MTPATSATAGTDQDPQLQRRLQQDTILLAGKTVYLNPFLYWRRFDTNTDRWLREPGQLQEDQIEANRQRFYPEVDWDHLEPDERAVKDGAVEMFLKSLELITTFNPELSAGHLLEVERKMAVTKKKAFERWVARALRRRDQEEQRQRRRFDRERFLRGWLEWFGHEGTRRAVLPFAALLVMAACGGWWAGAHRACAPSVVDPGVGRPSP